MGDACARHHQIDGTRLNSLSRPQAVPVFQRPFEKVGKGGQADMGVLANVHIGVGAKGSRAHMVDKDKRPYHPLFAEGQQPSDEKVPYVPAALRDDHSAFRHGPFMYLRYFKDTAFEMKKRTRNLSWALAVLLLAAAGFYTQYPKLSIISGYTAKNMASAVYVAGRSEESVKENDHSSGLISLASEHLDPERRSATATVLGMQRREAYFREGLGAVLLPVGAEKPGAYLAPQRERVPSPLPYPLGHAKPRDTVFPEVDYAQLARGLDQAFSNPEVQRTRTVAVLYKNHLVGERYTDGFGPDTPVLGWSMTKSVLATLYGIMLHQGRLAVMDKPNLPQWQGDARRDITYEDLLRMQSGLSWDEDYGGISDVTRMLFLSSDMTLLQAEKQLLGPPGTLWYYSSGTSNLLSGLLRKHFESDQEYLNFPYRELIDRIGMHSMLLETDLAGNFVGSSYGWASTRDWGRFGLLYLNEGRWGETQIFDPSWAAFVSTPTTGSDDGYGAHFWLNAGGKYPDAPRDMYMANGFEGQHVFIIPSRDLVVVRTGLAEDPDFQLNDFLREVLAAFP
jgi:CubicO group peptidase (beta-lactamase class C family)